MKKRMILLLSLICAAALAGCSVFQKPAEETPPAPVSQPARVEPDGVVAEGRLVPVRNADLAFSAGGRVIEVLVEAGQEVEAGQMLARLEGGEHLRAEDSAAGLEILKAEQALQTLEEDAFLALAQASAELEAAQKAYEASVETWEADEESPTAFDTAIEDYVAAEADVQEAQGEVDDNAGQAEDEPVRVQAKQRLEREQDRRGAAYEALLAAFEAPQESLDQAARTQLVAAIARLEDARLRLSKLNCGPDPEQKAVLEASLEAARQAQAAAEEGLGMLELRAPWSGTLVRWDLNVGEVIAAGQPVAALADTSAWEVETTDLTENGVVAVQAGDAVRVSVDALPGESFSGVVEFVEGKGEKSQGDVVYEVRVRMERADPRWYWNMTVKVEVE